MQKKEAKQAAAKSRLEIQLVSGTKVTKLGTFPLEEKDKTRIKNELDILKARLSGEKKKKVQKTGVKEEGGKGAKYFIDIFSISFSRSKRSERRKSKGKSRKKMRTVKTTSFLKSVTFQEGMVQAFREGRMGLSPRSHTFRIRKEEPNANY